ncbi:MAG: hypothetical protein CFE37_01845 [Alphaproteobacteria bacterium PA4]|nr:MAG: hypothetical protein CFE37_01845 [Alphaproteobacteria bacterium PA4]
MTFRMIAALLLLATPALAQDKQRVQFAKGSSNITLKGSIKGDNDRDYLVSARAGQVLTVMLKPSNASTYFNILPPGSTGEASFIGSSEGNRASQPISATGDTVIRVYLMRNAARRGESSSYTLDIGIAGGSDALVAGTPYNATATIRCVAEPDKPMTGCQAGVKRSGGGNASVHVATPDGGSRVINFRAGVGVGSDARAAFAVTRRGDVSVVRIGTVEVYEIPDAFVRGG